MATNKKVEELLKKLEKISDRASKEAANIRRQLRAEGYSLRGDGKKKEAKETTKAKEKPVAKKDAVKSSKVSKKVSSKKAKAEDDDDDDSDEDGI